MFYLNYDLAKHITAERRASARAASLRRDARRQTKMTSRTPRVGHADVIELTFAGQCQHEKIGA